MEIPKTLKTVTTYNINLFQHPWIVVFLKDNGKSVHCTGTLVHPNYAITAAHPLVDKQGDFPPNPSYDEIILAFGIDDISKLDWYLSY